MPGAFGLAAGELLAVDVAPGPAWVDIVHRCWVAGVPFLPVDARLTERERRALIDRAEPAAVLDAAGQTTVFGPSPAVTDGVAVVVATSGTSGAPRLVELGRSAIEAAVAGSIQALGIDAEAPWVSCLTPAHIGGLLVLLRAEVGGAEVTVLPAFDAHDVEGARSRGAHVSLVPPLVRRLVDAEGELSPGGMVIVGGDRLDQGLRSRAERGGARLVQTYGLTESSGGVVYDGEPFVGTDVRLGRDDRIELRGPTLMDGYRNDAAATGAAFDRDGWLRTDDAGSVERGVQVLGRLDDAISTGGETVWPEEVERALAEHPKVRDVAVVGSDHPTWGRQVTAFIVPVAIDDVPALPEVRAFLTDRLAPFKSPRVLELVSEIPRSSSGKIRRGALPPA